MSQSLEKIAVKQGAKKHGEVVIEDVVVFGGSMALYIQHFCYSV